MMFPRSLKSFAPLPFALALALGGCASAGPVSEGDEEVASAAEAAQETQAGPHGHGGKFGRPHGGHEFIGAALRALELTDAQRKTIEGALASLDDTHEADRKAFHKALADGVRAGKIDEAAASAKLGDVEKVASERRAAVAKALGTLHATLTPEQRAALVAHVEERMAKHGPEGGKHMRHHGPEDGAKHGPRGEHGPMGTFLRGLDLREEQRTQSHAALEASRPAKPEGMDREAFAKKHEEKRARAKAALEAFRGDKLDAEALLPPKDARPPMGAHLGHMVKALSAIVPVLDDAQRSALAQRIEEGPRMGPFGGKHGHHEHGETQAPPSR